MDVMLIWYVYGDQASSVHLPLKCSVRDLGRVILRKYLCELSSASRLRFFHADTELHDEEQLDTLPTSIENPIRVQLNPRMRRVWYWIFNRERDLVVDRTWVPMTSDVKALRERILRENVDVFGDKVQDPGQLEIYPDTWSFHKLTEPLNDDTWIGPFGTSLTEFVYVVVVGKARGISHVARQNPTLWLETTLATISLGFSLVYGFQYDAEVGPTIDDVILAKDGDWEFIKAEKSEIRQKGPTGPKYEVLANFPLTRMRMNEVYTRGEWELLGFASLVARNKTYQPRYLTQGLLDAVEGIANKEYWS